MKTPEEIIGSSRENGLTVIEGCQLPGFQRMSEGEVKEELQSPARLLKRILARPWNYIVKPRLKWFVRKFYTKKTFTKSQTTSTSFLESSVQQTHFLAGDLVLVRSREEIESTLDPFKELKGCAFLDTMWQYCGTKQRVLQPMARFLDERDYKVKKARGIVLLEGVLCHGTPVFGKCDRACHLFWREEWLEKVEDGGEI